MPAEGIGMRAILVLLAAALLSGPALAQGGEVTAQYIGGTHTLTGVVKNVPVIGELPLSSAVAVCQQTLRHPLLPTFSLTTPGVGGACSLPLPASSVAVSVRDATFGPLGFEYQPMDEAGEPCGALGSASSGAVLGPFAAGCAFLSIWPAASATYGTITITAA